MVRIELISHSKILCLSFQVYEIMETAPFGKRQKGEIGKNYFYVIIEVKTEQDPTLSDEFLNRIPPVLSSIIWNYYNTFFNIMHKI